MSLGHIKGSSIREFIAWYGREHGHDHLVSLIRRLSPEDQAVFDLDHPALGILPSTWYPMEPIHHVLDEMILDYGPDGIEDLARRGGDATVRAMMKGVYRVLFSVLMTPSRYAKVVGQVWKLNYDSGRVDHVDLGPTRQQSFVRGWKGHHRLLCKMNFAARVAIYREMGCRNLVVEDRYCVDDGNEECGSILAWSPKK